MKEKEMKEKFLKMGSTIVNGISVLVYGDPGVGKTTLAGTLPVGETLIINLEAGVGPLLGTNHIVMNFSGDNLDDMERLYKYLRTEKHPFKYVVVDNISELEQWILLSLTKRRSKEFVEIREYGDCQFKLREYLHLFRDLTEIGISVIFNAWEMTLDIRSAEGQVVTRTFPKMSKKLAPEACGLVDIVAHLEVHEKSGKRWLRIGPSEQYITKTQYQGLDDGEVADLPTILEKVYAYNYEKGGENDQGDGLEQGK